MIPVICIGRKNSKGFPNKNSYLINNIPLMAYPIIAANGCKYVDEVFFSSDSAELKNIADNYGANIINRPEYLAIDEALSDDVFVHAYNEIKKGLWPSIDALIAKKGNKEIYQRFEGQKIEFVVLLFANAPCITANMMNEMIEILRDNAIASSICTISKYNMYSPYRTRRINEHGWLDPFVKDIFEEENQVNCDRNSGDDAWFYDCSCAVVRPECIENMENGLLPQKWLGKNILGYKQDIPACDIDYEWQIGQLKYCLNKMSEL